MPLVDRCRAIIALFCIAHCSVCSAAEVTWTGADDGSFHVIHTPSGDMTIQYPNSNLFGSGQQLDSFGNILAPGNWSAPDYPNGPDVGVTIGAAIPGRSYPPRVGNGTPINVGKLTLLDNAQLIIEGGGFVTSTLVVNQGIENHGTISLNYPGSFPFARSLLTAGDGDVTLTGGGVITFNGLGDAGKPVSDWTIVAMQGTTANSRWINVNNTIQGGGFIGYGTAAIVNHALIDANAAGTGLAIQPNALGAQNDGTLRASNGGLLVLRSGTFDNSGGLIEAKNGSAVQLYNATVTGGTVEVQNGGTLRADPAGATDTGASFSQFTGTLVNHAGGQVNLYTTNFPFNNNTHLQFGAGTAVVNDGAIVVNGGATLTIAGAVTFSGSGDLSLPGGTFKGAK